MLESLPVILAVGTVLGFLSGIGVGGGSLLVLWLTVIGNMPPETARSINLLFFLPAGLIASFFRWRQGSFKPKKILPAIIAGCIFAVLFSWLSSKLDTEILKKLFGGLLIVAGLRELFYKRKKAS